MLALALVYCVATGPDLAFGAPAKHDARRLPRPRHHRVRTAHARTHRAAVGSTLGARAVTFARRLLGTPYRYGGDSPSTGFDCSGLVRFVYGHFGLRLPHSSYADFGLGVRVARSSLRPGDLVFFDGVGHVGLYVGGGRFIHAPHTGTDVQITSLNEPWYRATYDGARRLALPRSVRRDAARRARQLAAHRARELAQRRAARRFVAALRSNRLWRTNLGRRPSRLR